jgi:hypothetical protein
VYFVAIGPPVVKAVLVSLILPKVGSRLDRDCAGAGVFAAGVVGALVVVRGVVWVEVFAGPRAAGRAAVEVLVGVVVLAVGVVAAVAVEDVLAATLEVVPEEPSLQPASAPVSATHRHTAAHPRAGRATRISS